MKLLDNFFLPNIIILVLFKFHYSKSIDDLIQPKCNGKSINYSIVADLKTYLRNDTNIDGRDIYSSISDLKNKTVGVLQGTAYNSSDFENVIIYEKYDKIIRDLRNHKLDAIIVDNGIANYTQAFSHDISSLSGWVGMNYIGFAVQKDDQKLLNELNDFIDNMSSEIEVKKTWLGLDEDLKNILRNLNGTNGTINLMLKLENPPYSYLENGQVLGVEVFFIYYFAYAYGYQINLTLAETIQDQINCLKNKSIDIAGGFMPILDKFKNDILYTKAFHPSISNILIRYENSPVFATGLNIYDSVDDFNGEILGSLNESHYINITNSHFQKSELILSDSFYDLYTELLYENIEGFIIDKTIADYFQNRYPDRLTFYTENYLNNSYAFGFQKNDEGEKLLNEFNDFLSNFDTESLYNKWIKPNTSLLIDKNLNKSAKIINAAFFIGIRPMCYYEIEEEKGFELDLLYQFAKEKNYNINLTRINTTNDRINYITEGLANITGGIFSILEERKEYIKFSNPILETQTVLAVRTDSKKDYYKIVIVDNNFEEKPNNTVDIEVEFSNVTKNSSCVFPKEYNDTIIINCTISNITESNPYYEGFEYGNTSDKIRFIYYDFDPKNFFNANSFFPELNIIQESNKSNIICSNKSSSDTDDDNFNKFNNSTSKGHPRLSKSKVIAISVSIGVILILFVCVIIMSYKPKAHRRAMRPSPSESNLVIRN